MLGRLRQRQLAPRQVGGDEALRGPHLHAPYRAGVNAAGAQVRDAAVVERDSGLGQVLVAAQDGRSQRVHHPHRRAHQRHYQIQIVDHRSEEHTSELQSPCNLVCRLLLEKKQATAAIPWELVTNAPAKLARSATCTASYRQDRRVLLSSRWSTCIMTPRRAGASGQTIESPSMKPMLVMEPSETAPPGPMNRASSKPLPCARPP